MRGELKVDLEMGLEELEALKIKMEITGMVRRVGRMMTPEAKEEDFDQFYAGNIVDNSTELIFVQGKQTSYFSFNSDFSSTSHLAEFWCAMQANLI